MKKKAIILAICMMLVIPVATATAALNNPPDTPTIEGPTKGKSGVSYEYEICSSDPDGDDISYCIDWGEGSGEICKDPVPSETCILETHAFASKGTYTIKVKAQDGKGGESDYATLEVTISKGQAKQLFFQAFLERLFLRFNRLRILIN